jgi:nicotinamide-nucleotide amidase
MTSGFLPAKVTLMRVEIINTGTELLLGQVTNTHLGFLAQGLFGLGLRVERQVTVPDGVAIAEALGEAMGRAELIIVTGGLGPTSDDITRDAAAEAFGKKLIFHQEILDGIAAKFAARNFAMNDLQRPQAMVPEGGVVLDNANGTAPGLIIENDKTVAVLLPGPPNELKPMWTNEALPWLRQRFADQLAAVHEITLRILGLGETRVQMLVEDEVKALGPVEVGYCARSGEVDLRLIAPNQALVEKAAALARGKLGDVIYAEGGETMEQAVVRLARAAGKIVATAESCTGGLVASRITNVSGSSDMFRYGWITYANEAKIKELGVPPDLLEKHGAVSAEVAQAMAEGALRNSGADLAIAVTGIAGPTGGTPEKPVGLVYFAIASTTGVTQVLERNLSCQREIFKMMASQVALDLLRRALI